MSANENVIFSKDIGSYQLHYPLGNSQPICLEKGSKIFS